MQAAAEALLPTCAEFEAGRPETCGHSTKCRHPMSPIGRKYNPLFLPFQGEGGVGEVQALQGSQGGWGLEIRLGEPLPL